MERWERVTVLKECEGMKLYVRVCKCMYVRVCKCMYVRVCKCMWGYVKETAEIAQCRFSKYSEWCSGDVRTNEIHCDLIKVREDGLNQHWAVRAESEEYWDSYCGSWLVRYFKELLHIINLWRKIHQNWSWNKKLSKI